MQNTPSHNTVAANDRNVLEWAAEGYGIAALTIADVMNMPETSAETAEYLMAIGAILAVSADKIEAYLDGATGTLAVDEETVH